MICCFPAIFNSHNSRYQTVASDFDSLKGHQKKISLFSIEWERVVLDEAHNIRNSLTKAFKAVFELKSKNKWCLTGV
jgi:SNF2 family DNA or RNA helicase